MMTAPMELAPNIDVSAQPADEVIDAVRAANFLLQSFQLPRQRTLFESVLHPQAQLFYVKRLGHIIKSARAFRSKCRAPGVESGQHDHLTIAVSGFDLFQHRKSVRPRHHNIQQYNVRVFFRRFLDRVFSGRRLDHSIRFVEHELE